MRIQAHVGCESLLYSSFRFLEADVGEISLGVLTKVPPLEEGRAEICHHILRNASRGCVRGIEINLQYSKLGCRGFVPVE